MMSGIEGVLHFGASLEEIFEAATAFEIAAAQVRSGGFHPHATALPAGPSDVVVPADGPGVGVSADADGGAVENFAAAAASVATADSAPTADSTTGTGLAAPAEFVTA